MADRKVVVMRILWEEFQPDERSLRTGNHLCDIMNDDDVVAAIVLSHNVELTASQFHHLERMFSTLFKERVSVIY